MSKLQTRFIDDTYLEYYNTGNHDLAQIYLKSEADKVIAELEESHKMEVEQLLIERAELKEGAKNLILDNYLQDKEIRHHKYKRCLNMAKWCKLWYEEEKYEWQLKDVHHWFKMSLFDKWHKRWLELAEKFKT